MQCKSYKSRVHTAIPTPVIPTPAIPNPNPNPNPIVSIASVGKAGAPHKSHSSSILPQTFEHDIESCESSSGSNN